MQLRIHADVDEQCPDRGKSRFPFFEETMWYLAHSFTEQIHNKKWSLTNNEFSPVQIQGINLLSKWIKFYKTKKPSSISSAQYVIDTISFFLDGVALPIASSYPPDEEHSDSVENNNNECFECGGRVESNLWIGCDNCSNWFHAECVGFTKKELDDLTKSEREYICARCSVLPDDFDVLHEKKKVKTKHDTSTTTTTTSTTISNSNTFVPTITITNFEQSTTAIDTMSIDTNIPVNILTNSIEIEVDTNTIEAVDPLTIDANNNKNEGDDGNDMVVETSINTGTEMG